MIKDIIFGVLNNKHMNTTRTLTDLEIELISIVKMQSAKLLEAADYVAHIGGVIEAIKDFRSAADVQIYVADYGIDLRQAATCL